ncbi:MAG TPA: hypothetical protein VHA74_03035 [Candidatus Dojkabacteria bacterium]|nr:hypothetical protein [Candidatus Dojkabacteria bacterium]
MFNSGEKLNLSNELYTPEYFNVENTGSIDGNPSCDGNDNIQIFLDENGLYHIVICDPNIDLKAICQDYYSDKEGVDSDSINGCIGVLSSKDLTFDVSTKEKQDSVTKLVQSIQSVERNALITNAATEILLHNTYAQLTVALIGCFVLLRVITTVDFKRLYSFFFGKGQSGDTGKSEGSHVIPGIKNIGDKALLGSRKDSIKDFFVKLMTSALRDSYSYESAEIDNTPKKSKFSVASEKDMHNWMKRGEQRVVNSLNNEERMRQKLQNNWFKRFNDVSEESLREEASFNDGNDKGNDKDEVIDASF